MLQNLPEGIPRQTCLARRDLAVELLEWLPDQTELTVDLIQIVLEYLMSQVVYFLQYQTSEQSVRGWFEVFPYTYTISTGVVIREDCDNPEHTCIMVRRAGRHEMIFDVPGMKRSIFETVLFGSMWRVTPSEETEMQSAWKEGTQDDPEMADGVRLSFGFEENEYRKLESDGMILPESTPSSPTLVQ